MKMPAAFTIISATIHVTAENEINTNLVYVNINSLLEAFFVVISVKKAV